MLHNGVLNSVLLPTLKGEWDISSGTSATGSGGMERAFMGHFISQSK